MARRGTPDWDDPRTHASRWAALPRPERGRLMRALRAGETLGDQTDAQLVVMEARRQRRYWSRVWLLGPAAGVLQYSAGVWAVVGGVIAGVAVTGGLSLWQYRRAARAEQVNLDVATGAARRAKAEARKRRKQQARQAPGDDQTRGGRIDPNTSARKRKRRKR